MCIYPFSRFGHVAVTWRDAVVVWGGEGYNVTGGESSYIESGFSHRYKRGAGPSCDHHRDPCDPSFVYYHLSGVWKRDSIQCCSVQSNSFCRGVSSMSMTCNFGVHK